VPDANDNVFIDGGVNQARIPLPRRTFPPDRDFGIAGNSAMTRNPKKGPRIRHTPKTGTRLAASPHRAIVFKPSAILTRRINSPTRGDAA
jgi:hypothetical protein